MNNEPNSQSYRVALETALADLKDIRVQIDQLNAMKERLEQAAEALKLMVSLRERVSGAVPQPAADAGNQRAAESPRSTVEPLFASGFRPVSQLNDAPGNTGSELRSLAALA